MGKCCKNLRCSVSGETYEIVDATARKEIEELKKNGGGASGPVMAVRSFASTAPVYIQKSDLPGIVNGSAVIISIMDGEPSYGPPGCTYTLGGNDLSYEQEYQPVPAGGLITFDYRHKIIYAYFENEKFHIPAVYNRQYDFRARVISGDHFTLGISPADVTENVVTVTYWKE